MTNVATGPVWRGKVKQRQVRRDEIPVSGEMRLPQRIEPGEGILVHFEGQDQGRGVCGFKQGSAQ